MFSIRILWLMAVGVAFVYAAFYGHLAVFYLNSDYGEPYWPLMLALFLPCSAAVGLSLWVIWSRYAKVSGRFLFLRVFGVMAVGPFLFWAVISFLTLVSPYYPEDMAEPDLVVPLFFASIAGASLGVIFTVYRKRFGDSL